MESSLASTVAATSGIRRERVIVETERYRLTGSLSVPESGYRSRVSDLFNSADREFIALSDVEVEALGSNEPPAHRDFLAVSRRHVVFVTVTE
jgi:hypothetical protein